MNTRNYAPLCAGGSNANSNAQSGAGFQQTHLKQNSNGFSRLCSALFLFVFMTLALPAYAIDELVINGGFETDAVGSTTITGWNITGTAVVGTPSGGPLAGQNTASGLGNTEGINQTISTVAGVTYALSYQVNHGGTTGGLPLTPATGAFDITITGAAALLNQAQRIAFGAAPKFQHVFTADSSTTNISFTSNITNADLIIDNVSVQQVNVIPGGVSGGNGSIQSPYTSLAEAFADRARNPNTIKVFKINGQFFSSLVDADGYVLIASADLDEVNEAAGYTQVNSMHLQSDDILPSAVVMAMTPNELRMDASNNTGINRTTTNTTMLTRFTNYQSLSIPDGSSDGANGAGLWAGTGGLANSASNPAANESLNTVIWHASGNGSNLHWFPRLVNTDGFSFGITTLGGANDTEMNLWARNTTALPITSGPIDLWLRADEGGAAWTDQSGNGVIASAVGAPAIATNLINFNQAVAFNGTSQYYNLNGNLGFDATTANHAIYSVFIDERTSGFGAIIAGQLNNGGEPQFLTQGTTPRNIYLDKNGVGNARSSTAVIPQNAPTLVSATIGSNTNLNYYFNGLSDNSFTDFPHAFNGNNLRLGASSFSGSPAFYYDGAIAETIVYASSTANDRNRIESYLALKYGITLNQSTNTSYFASDCTDATCSTGTKVWDAAILNTNNNDIFGIGRDDDSGLDQRVSKSVNADAIMTVSLDNDFTSANNDASRTTTFASDLQFLTVGNDNASLALQSTGIDPTTGFYQRVGREWRISNSSGLAVNVQFEGFAGYAVISNENGVFTTPAGVNNLGVLDINGRLSNVTFSHNHYITLAPKDTDNDGVFDLFDLDDDNDGILDTVEDAVALGDADGIINSLDLDSDDDGIPDNIEAQSTVNFTPFDITNTPANYVTNNGVNSAYLGGLTPQNTDATALAADGVTANSDLLPDYVDTDSDNDGFTDTAEAGLTLTGTVGNNGLVASSDLAADDYSQPRGSFDDTQTNNFTDSDLDVLGNVILVADVDYRDDTSVVNFTTATTAAQTVTEGDAGTTAVSTAIGLSSASGKAITAPYTVTGTATGGGTDYTLANGNVIITAGATSAPLNFVINNDLIDEVDETIIITLSAPTNATAGTTIQVHTVTIVDNDTAVVDFTAVTTAAQAITEGDAGTTAGIATVGLSAPSAVAISVPYVVAGVDATSGTDFTLASGVANFAAGVTTADINFTVTGDLLDESDESFSITLGTPTNAVSGTTIQVHTVTITDNDTAVVDLATAAQSIVEGNTGSTAGTASIALSTPSTLAVSVPYTVIGVDAISGTDYVLTSGTANIAAGDTTANIDFTITGDLLDEADETFTITLGAPTNATAGTTIQVQTVTITDDDVPPVVDFTATTTATQTILEGDTGTVSGTATIGLNAISALDVTVPYTVAGTATGSGTDYSLADGAVTISAGQLTADVSFTVTGDTSVETNENFVITLGAPTNATAGTTIQAHTVNIMDNDVDLTMTTLVAAPNAVPADGSNSSTITVQLKNASGENLTSSGGVVALATSGTGVLSGVTDNGNGTYTATVTDVVAETITISGTLDGAAITATDAVTFAAGAADPTQSVITAGPVTVLANGTTTSTITIKLLDTNGTALNSSGGIVTLSTTGSGMISAVTDNGDGTYTATITDTVAEIANISGTVNAAAITDTADVSFVPDNANPDPANSNTTLTAGPSSVVANGTTTSTVTVQLADANGNLLSASGGTVALAATGSAVLGAVTDNGNGTYTATVTNTMAESVTISGTLDSGSGPVVISNTASVSFTPDNTNASPTNVNTTLTAGPSSVVANGTTTSTVMVQLADANGNLLTASGGTVALAATGSAVLGAVTDNGNGTYTATVTNTTAESVTISGTLNGAAISNTTSVTFTSDNSNPAGMNTNTTIITTPPSVVANGVTTSLITVQLADPNGNLLTTGGATVVLSTPGSSTDVLSVVTDNGNGTYTATISNTIAESVTISGTVNAAVITDTANASFTADNSNADPTNIKSTLVADTASVVADGVTTSTVTVQLADVNGNLLTASGGTVVLTTSGGTLTGVTDNGDGTYTATIANTTAEAVTISATLNGNPITDTANVIFTANNANPDPTNANTTLVAAPANNAANGTSISTITVQLADSNGNLLTASAGTLVLSTTGSAVLSPVIDNGNGSYTATITNTIAEIVTISGTLDSGSGAVAIPNTATVTYSANSNSPDATNTNTTIVAGPSSVIADGTTTSTITVQLADTFGNTISIGGANVQLFTPGSTTDLLSTVTDNGDGTYTATVRNTIAESVTISGTVNGVAINDTANTIFTANNADPDPANINTTIVAAPASVVADGTVFSTITVQLADSNGNLLTASAGTIALVSTGTGMVTGVIDNLNGSYTATVSNIVAQTVTISGALDGNPIADTADVIFTPDSSSPDVNSINTRITAAAVSVVADGTTTSTVTVQLADVNNNLLTASAGVVALTTTGGTLTAVVDNLNGTYTATITNITAETVTISGTLGGNPIANMATVAFTPNNANPNPGSTSTTIVAGPVSVVADGLTASTITVQLADANDNLLTASGGTVALTTTSGTVSAVVDNGNGTYTATIVNSTAETVVVSGTLDSGTGPVAITDMANVTFTPNNSNPDPMNANTSIIAGPSSVVADGATTSIITVQLSDVNGNLLSASGGVVALTATGGTVSGVVDNGNGSYTATIVNTTAETVTISGTLDGNPITNTADVAFTPDNSNPDPANVNTTLTAGPSSVVADGVATSTITVQLADANGNLLSASGGVVALTATGGTVSGVVDNGNGSYTATIVNTTVETVTISGTLDGTPIVDTADVAFTPDNSNPDPLNVNTTIVAGPSSVVADGVTRSTITVQLADVNGNLLSASGGVVALTATGGTISSVVDNGNGTYTATITNSTAESITVSGTLDGNPITDTADVTFTADNSSPDPANVNTTITAGPTSVVADGTTTSTITVQLADVNGNLMTGSGGTVALNATGNAVISAVVDNGDGTYTATMTNTTAETVTVSGTLDGVAIADTATLTFNTDNTNPDPTNVNTTITAVGTTVAADGTSTSTVTVQLADANGNLLSASGGTVTLSSTGSAVLSAVVDNGDGSYTTTVTNAVEEVVTITGTLDGTAITDDADIFFNGAPPPVVIDSITTTTTMVTGTSEPGTTISFTNLTCDNAPVITSVTGVWVCDTVTVPPVEGDVVTVLATDANGNMSPASTTVVTNSTTTSAAPSIKVIDDDDLVITGMATPGATVTPSITCDNAPVIADVNGNWSCDITTAGAQVVGTDVTATAQEPGLAISPPSSTPVISNATFDAPPLVPPTDGSVVTGMCDVPNAAVEIFNVTVPALVCMTTADAVGDFSCAPLTPAPSNADVLSVTCSNPSTGQASPPSLVVTDLMPPVITGDNILQTNDTTPSLTGTSDQADGTTVAITDAANNPVCTATVTAGVWTCDVATALPEGLATFTVAQSDSLGNEGTASFTVNVELDADGDGIPDDQEPPRPIDTDGDGIPDADDNDADGDGIPDGQECGPSLPCADSDGDGIPDFLEPNNIDADGDGIPNYLDNDDDGDGVSTVDEIGNPLTPTDTDGDGIADYLESGDNSTDPNSDSDGDGILDADECPNGVCDDTDGNSVPDYLDTDSDQDGISDADECSSLPCADTDADGIPDYQESNTNDFDGDGIPNNQDPDDDGDGIPTLTEIGGVGAPLKRQDTDGDGLVDYLDRAGTADSDGDGRSDAEECGMVLPCPDTDYDNIPDYLDTDDDNDGIPSSAETGDSDGDGIIDALESDIVDTDNDGVVDADDADDDGDGVPTANESGDSDGDGIPDYLEPNNLDSDGDGTNDYLDADDNNDGIPTRIQIREIGSKFTDTDGDGIPDYVDGDPNGGQGGGDSDGDGISDADECVGGFICPDQDGDGIPDYLDAGLACEATNTCIVLTGTTKGGGSFGWLALMMLLGLLGVKGSRASTRGEILNSTALDGGSACRLKEQSRPIQDLSPHPRSTLNKNKKEKTMKIAASIALLSIAMFSVPQGQKLNAHIGDSDLTENAVSGEAFASEYSKYKAGPERYCDSDYEASNKEAKRIHSAYCQSDWYIGIAAMQNRLTPLAFQTDYVVTDNSDGGFKLFVGKRYQQHWRVEAFVASLGTTELSSQRFGVGTIDYDLLYGVSAARDFHIGSPRFVVFPKVGVTGLKDSANNINRSRENDYQFYAGFGFEFDVNQTWGLRAEYESFTNDIESISVGLTYKF